MAKNYIKVSANVADTVRPKVAGATQHPGWHALRTIAGRITTPLCPSETVSPQKAAGAISQAGRSRRTQGSAKAARSSGKTLQTAAAQ